MASGQRLEAFGVPSLALDGDWVYWTAAGDGAVRRVPTAGGAVEEIAVGLERPVSLAVRDGSLWVLDTETRSILRHPVSGGAPTLVLQSPQTTPWGVAVDDSYVYFTNYHSSGPVQRVCR